MIRKYEIKETQRAILDSIIKNPGLSRADIAKLFNLNKSTASYITKDLENQNLINFIKGKNKKGRLGTYIHFNHMYEKVLFVEYSKRKIKSFICYLNGDILQSYIIRIENNEKREEYLRAHIKEIKEKNSLVKNCVFAVHGIIDKESQKINSPFYELMISDIENIFILNNIKVHIENESNIYSLGILEDSFRDVAVNIQIKDGIGCGLVINGELFRGFNGTAGEIGHTIAKENGRHCNCGNDGCLELYASDSNVLIDCKQEILEDITRNNFFEYYEKYESIRNIVHTNIDLLADAINNLYVTLNPSVINITSEIYSKVPDFKELLEKKLRNYLLTKPKIYIYNYDINILIKGFCKLYMSLVI